MEDLLDDGDDRLLRICGPEIHARLQKEGYTLFKLWGADASEIYGKVHQIVREHDLDGAFKIASQIWENICVPMRAVTLLGLVEEMKTSNPQLEKWIEERLAHLPVDGRAAKQLQRSLDCLKAKPREKKDEVRDQLAMERAMKLLRRAYVGKAHETLYEELRRVHAQADEDEHYSCYTSIVQSSGTGKTRGVLEMSRLGVYICYCSCAAADSFACPPRSGKLADKLCATSDELDMARYFKAWLSVLADKTSKSETRMGSVAWMESQRDTSLIRDEVLKRWESYCSAGPEVDSNVDYDERNVCLLQPELDKLELPKAQNKVQILFVFDEARSLLPPDAPGVKNLKDRGLACDSSYLRNREKAVGASPFYQMRRVSRVFFKYRQCFSVVLDTAATVSNMHPTLYDDHSRKVRLLGLRLLSPLYQVLNMDLVTPTGDLSPKEVFRLGRPLWSSRIESGESMEEFLSFVGNKLVGGVFSGDLRGEKVDVHGLGGTVILAESQAMALFSATVGLEICPSSVLSQLLVASHTSVVTFISGDSTRIHVSHPVEPAVSEAATRILNRRDGQALVVALERLNHAFLSGYCGRGDRGELACKMLVLMAAWRLFDQRFYLRPIPIRDYLQSLMGRPKNEVDKACRGLPEESYVFFSSFMLVNEKTKLTPQILSAAYLRGCAIHFKAGNQVRAYDFLVPVYTPKGMTAIVFSAKNVANEGNMRKQATEVLSPQNVNVRWTSGLTVITIFINASEPDGGRKTSLEPSKIWAKNEFSKTYRKHFDKYAPQTPVVHMSLYGLLRNTRGLALGSDGGVKEEKEMTNIEKEVRKLMADILISAPDTEKEAAKEVAKNTVCPGALDYVRKLAPDVYNLHVPDGAEYEGLAAFFSRVKEERVVSRVKEERVAKMEVQGESSTKKRKK